MAIQNNNFAPKQSDDFICLQDLFYLCIDKWYWFAVSLVVTLGIALVYLLTTPPVYTRSASLLIKEEGKGNSLSDVSGVLGDIDFFQTNTNVNNEIQSLQSPAVMYDVVKRLHLDINYTKDGSFYDQVLYGKDCPYEVSFIDLPDNEDLSFTIYPASSNKGVQIGDFVRGEEESGQTVNVLFNRNPGRQTDCKTSTSRYRGIQGTGLCLPYRITGCDYCIRIKIDCRIE